jgi:bifunctional DNA-binding transcriptional regulator/antitoxin component of YhaV-PrlF toxin-antitoxin module
MAITRKELEELISVKPKVEKVATLSSDGKNLLLRVPKEIREMFSLDKGDKVRFVVDDKQKINFEVIKNAEEKEKRS